MSAKRSDVLWVFLWVMLCELAGFVGSFFTTPNIPTWYAGLNKPVFNPPSWVFAPVWIMLYAMMGVSVFLYSKKKGFNSLGVRVFAIQLALNTLWSIAFFGLHSPAAGLVIIAALWATIAWTMRIFRKDSETAYKLLVPYILWVSFAAVLNLAILLLN